MGGQACFRKTGSSGHIGIGGGPTSAKFRIDHCTFDNSATEGLKHAIQVFNSQFGVIDHCTFLSGTNSEHIHNHGRSPPYSKDGAPDWTNDVSPGSDQALYIEDCKFINTDTPNGNFLGNAAMQNYYGSRVVFRHNELNMSHLDVHGTPGMVGGRWFEIYNNNFIITGNQSDICAIRAGTGVIFNNTKTTDARSAGWQGIAMREEDGGGYPQLFQVGRGKNQTRDPLYIWNNPNTAVGGDDLVQLNRDYYVNTPRPGYVPLTYPHPLVTGSTGSIPPAPSVPSVPFPLCPSAPSSPTVLPGLSWESTAGVIQSPFTESGGYVSQPVETKDPSAGGQATYDFEITAAGNYTISANVNSPNVGANSFYVNVDAQPTDPTMIWDVPIGSGPTSVGVSWRGSGTDVDNEFSPKIFSLSAGVHKLIIRGREAGTQLGKITISPAAAAAQPQAPANLRVLSAAQ